MNRVLRFASSLAGATSALSFGLSLLLSGSTAFADDDPIAPQPLASNCLLAGHTPPDCPGQCPTHTMCDNTKNNCPCF